MLGTIARKGGIAIGAIALGGLAAFLGTVAVDRHDMVLAAFSAAAGLGAVSMVWHRLLYRPIAWVYRAAALILLGIVALTIYAWLQQTDVFMICRGTPSEAPGTIWKLVFVWAIGVCATSVIFFGSSVEDFATRKLRELRNPINTAWWLAQGAWAFACIAVLVRNISVEIMKNSLLVAGGAAVKIAIALVVMFGSIAALVWITTGPSRKRDKAARADFEALPEDHREAIRRIVESYAHSCTERTVYFQEMGTESWDVMQPHIGGGAMLPPQEAWPSDRDGTPMALLIQLALPDIFPEPWKGKVVAIWANSNEYEFHARLYSGADCTVEVQQPHNVPASSTSDKKGLEPLVLPAGQHHEADEVDEDDDVCTVLLDACPELQEQLSSVTTQPELVLAKILSRNIRAEALESWNAVWVGGSPGLIQGEHPADCSECGSPMRFLMSTGDFTQEMLMGDAGVLYLYGCDAHPHALQWFVDCH